MLQATALEHRFGARQVLAPIDLSVRPGQCVALVGPSGCGKTTLLRLCAGLLAVQSGHLHNGFARTAVMFQQALLLLLMEYAVLEPIKRELERWRNPD